jgi:hypothetical protein
MPVPDLTPPVPVSPIIEWKMPVITRETVQSYLLCKVKGHLKLIGERGTLSDYETLMTELRASLAHRAADKLVASQSERDVLRGLSVQSNSAIGITSDSVATPSLMGDLPYTGREGCQTGSRLAVNWNRDEGFSLRHSGMWASSPGERDEKYAKVALDRRHRPPAQLPADPP